MFQFFQKRKFLLLLIDLCVYCFCYFLISWVVSHDINFFNPTHAFFVVKGLVLLAFIFFSRFLIKMYASLWRYANYRTYTKIIVADFCGAVAFYLVGLFIDLTGIFERHVRLAIEGVALITSINLLATLVSRFLYQLFYAYEERQYDKKNISETDNSNKINVAILGAGNIGVALARTLKRNVKSRYNPVCFIDKNKQKIGSIINGLHVYDECDNAIEKLNVKEIIIAIENLKGEDKERLFSLYKGTNYKVKLYDYQQLGNENGEIVIRNLKIEDLLCRETINLSANKNENIYKGKTVLITGGGGSIGSEICRQIAKLEPEHLVIFDIYENNAYEIQQELIRKYGDKLNLSVYIGSVRDVKRLDYIFNLIRPDIVVHAAAHKHVPLMEDSACEAIKNNVFGTYNTANMAEKYGAQRFILISTDKAVNPTNVMGASKRLCEMIVQCRKDSVLTSFMAVRFGNVLGSNGSVIPLFKKQIENGGPITITDKRIIRYFMTIPEATGLVLQAGSFAKKGELFVLNMGKPVKILDLAENMIRLSGLTPYEDIDIVEIGLRPGEKLYEELLMKNEELEKTESDMIFIERDKPYTRLEMEEKLEILSKALEKGDNESIRNALKEIVPTYISPEFANKKLNEIIKSEKLAN